MSNNQVRGIARKRMDILVRLSEKEALGGNMERAKRYMTIARRISGRNKVPMPKGRCTAATARRRWFRD